MTSERSSEAVPRTLATSLMACAEAMADAAARHSLAHFRSASLAVENKLDGRGVAAFDPVTVADRAAEGAMREVLAELRPHDGILGEEMGQSDGSSGLDWVIDPIDGTRAYMIGAPTWGTLIAVCDATGPILGMIDQPHTGERWTGGLGRADLRHRGRTYPLVPRGTADLGDALLCTTFPEVGTPAESAAFRRVAGSARLTRYGMDCYAYALVASGGVDLVIEAGLHAYDLCGPIGVIEAAGGIVTDWSGRPAHNGGRALAAANPAIHAAALELLNAG